MSTEWSIKEKREYQKWLDEKASIKRSEPLVNETAEQKRQRIDKLLGDFRGFSRYYFGHLMDSDFGWFHLEAAAAVVANPDLFLIAEWPREHAKSVFFDIIIPTFLKARGELTGMMIASASFDKAKGLLGDIQAELMMNTRYIADFGEQFSLGNWQEGNFSTADGIGFWAFGRGQSPRGTRKGEKRPNYGVIDDIDDAQIVKNEQRVDEAVDWVLGDFYGAMPNTGSRLIVAGNRINKKSILAKLVGDIEPEDPKRDGIIHIKVFALQNRKREKDLSTSTQPAWKERYTVEQIRGKMARMGWRIGLREFFHEHVIIGRIFREENLVWAPLPGLSKYDKIITYNDPSFKGTKSNDYKAIILMGRMGRYFDIIGVFCRQCTTGEMVRGHINLAAQVPQSINVRNYMEANFIQDLLLEEYEKEADNGGRLLNIRPDRRKKPDKEGRIENLSPLTERHVLRFNIDLKHDPDMQVLRSQFLAFPDDAHDDGPDAVEGAVFILNKEKPGKRGTPPRTGGYKTNESRRA